MYEDLDEEDAGSPSGLPGNGPSIHEMLASLGVGSTAQTQPEETSPSAVSTKSSTQLHRKNLTSISTSRSEDSIPEHGSLVDSNEKLSIRTQDLDDLSSSAETLSIRSTTDHSINNNAFSFIKDSNETSLILFGDSIGLTTSPVEKKEKEVEPPNTDQVVNALESVLLDSDCRPQDLLVNLQLICAFSPTSVLDLKDEVSSIDMSHSLIPPY